MLSALNIKLARLHFQTSLKPKSIVFDYFSRNKSDKGIHNKKAGSKIKVQSVDNAVWVDPALSNIDQVLPTEHLGALTMLE